MIGNYNTLSQFAQEIERREATKQDYVVNSSLLLMPTDETIFSPMFDEHKVSNYAHGQISSYLNIPKKYYDQMGAIPDLRRYNVNSWFKHKGENRMIRTLDGNARAFLSDRFRPLDHNFLMLALLPLLESEVKNVEIKSLSITDTKMYFQIIMRNMEAEITKGDVVQYGLTITNSEVGAGAVNVETFIWRLICLNGMIGKSLMRSYHVGKQIDYENADIFQNDTIKAERISYKLRLRDVMRHAMEESVFANIVEKMKAAAEDRIEKPQAMMKNVTQRFGLSEDHGDMILSNMIEEGNLSRWGLANGITALAKSIENMDRQYEYEKLGNAIIELPKSEWKNLAEVA